MSFKLFRSMFIKQRVLLNGDLSSRGDDLESKDEVSLGDQNHKRTSEP